MKRIGKILTTIFIAGIVLAGGHFGYKYRHEIKDFFTPTKSPHTDSETIETQDINDFLFDNGSVVGYQGSSKKVTIPTTYSEQKQTNEQSYEFAMPLDTYTSDEETYNKYNAEFEVYKQTLIDQLTDPGVKGRHLRYLIRIYNENERTTYVGDNYNYDNLEEAVNFVNSSLPKLTNSTATIKVEGITYSNGADTVVTDIMNFGLFETAGVENLNIPATILTLPTEGEMIAYGNFNINVEPSNLNYSSIETACFTIRTKQCCLQIESTTKLLKQLNRLTLTLLQIVKILTSLLSLQVSQQSAIISLKILLSKTLQLRAQQNLQNTT